MKTMIIVIGFVLVAGAFIIFANIGAQENDKSLDTSKVILPISIDNYYPPQSPEPTYLLAMLELAKSFSGIVCDVLENDLVNAQTNFGVFKKAYIENATMIPRWESKYPMEPIEHLGSVIASGDPSKIMPAIEAVGAICHNCHVTYMAPVQQKFRWGNFGDILINDPLSGQNASYAQLMLMMEVNFEGIANDIQQGQNENALRQFDGFKARFQTVSDACMICHDTERYYFVSEDITGTISDLQVELSRPAVDMGKVDGLLQTIGRESCTKCHLVHIPAAYSQLSMKRN